MAPPDPWDETIDEVDSETGGGENDIPLRAIPGNNHSQDAASQTMSNERGDDGFSQAWTLVDDPPAY